MKYILWGVFILLEINTSSSAALAQSKCSDFLGTDETPVIWNFVTARNLEFYVQQLTQINSLLARVKSATPPYEFSGQTSVLSLGEGSSNFILSMLQSNEQGVYHAVDVKGEHVDDARELLGVPSFYDNKDSYPQNYHFSLFQDMTLRSANGERLAFDEIISSWSLSLVIEESSSKSSAAALLNILSHLKVGGTIRMWPGRRRGLMYKVYQELQDQYGFKLQITSHDRENIEPFILIHKVSDFVLRIDAKYQHY